MSGRLTCAVWMVTYNHEKFIAQAIESILSQKTEYDFRIFIGDDCSTDGTTGICMQYAKQYPDKIFFEPIPSNIGSNANGTRMYHVVINSGAKYLALCEGDDFWIDPEKLQKQISYLEANPDCATVCAHAKKVDAEGNEMDLVAMPERERFTICDLAPANFIFTASSVFRAEHVKEAIEMPDFRITLAGDYFIEMIAASHGYIYYFREVQVAWRIHGGGAWGNKPLPVQLLNGLYCQYLMIRNLPGQTEACALLDKTVADCIQKLYATAGFNLNESLATFKDERFRTMMEKRYVEFQNNLKRKQHPSPTVWGKLKSLFRG